MVLEHVISKKKSYYGQHCHELRYQYNMKRQVDSLYQNVFANWIIQARTNPSIKIPVQINSKDARTSTDFAFVSCLFWTVN